MLWGVILVPTDHRQKNQSAGYEVMDYGLSRCVFCETPSPHLLCARFVHDILVIHDHSLPLIAKLNYITIMQAP